MGGFIDINQYFIEHFNKIVMSKGGNCFSLFRYLQHKIHDTSAGFVCMNLSVLVPHIDNEDDLKQNVIWINEIYNHFNKNDVNKQNIFVYFFSNIPLYTSFTGIFMDFEIEKVIYTGEFEKGEFHVKSIKN